MQDPRKVLRQNNIKMKDFVGNKIILFDKEELEKAENILKKAGIDVVANGYTIQIKGELKEETTSADIGPDVVVMRKKKQGDNKMSHKSKKSNIWSLVQRRLTDALVEKDGSTNWKDIVREFDTILKVDVKDKTIIVKGKSKDGRETTKEYIYNSPAIAREVARRVEYLKNV